MHTRPFHIILSHTVFVSSTIKVYQHVSKKKKKRERKRKFLTHCLKAIQSIEVCLAIRVYHFLLGAVKFNILVTVHFQKSLQK